MALRRIRALIRKAKQPELVMEPALLPSPDTKPQLSISDADNYDLPSQIPSGNKEAIERIFSCP